MDMASSTTFLGNFPSQGNNINMGIDLEFSIDYSPHIYNELIIA